MNGDQLDESTMTYEQLVDALEQVTQRMADGQVGIEEAADLYEQACHLHALASERLELVRERIERLSPPPEG
jgi:exodeoxyribonuclease VII small subunit